MKTDPKNLTILGSERAEERRLFETAMKLDLASERYAGDHVRWMMPLFPNDEIRHHAYLLESIACVLMTRELPYMIRAYRTMNLHAGWLEARDWDVGSQARDAMSTARCRVDRMIGNL